MRRLPLVLLVPVFASVLGAALVGPPAVAADSFTWRNNVLDDQGAYGEPSLAVADTGQIAVCVPGGAGETSVWYSGDDGRTFGTSHTNSANGGGDCEIDFLPNGRLINVDLEISDSAVRVSEDFGATWSGTETAGIEQDRQWLAHSPDGETVYLVYHDFVVEAEFYAQSNDGGLTWPESMAAIPVTAVDQAAAPGAATTPASGDPASLLDQGVNTFSGPMLVSPDGQDLYVLYSISDLGTNLTSGTPPFGPGKGIVVAHKGSEQTAFTNNYAVVDTAPTTNGAIFPWGAVDEAGTVYVFYNSDKGSPGNFHAYYVFSTDKAASWSDPVQVDDRPLDQGAQIYSTGDAGAKGVVDIAWYGADGGDADDPANTWDVYFAQIRDADTTTPTISRSKISKDPIHLGDICLNGLLCIAGGDRSLLDFFELAIGPDGMAQVAYADNEGFGRGGRVVWAKQASGPSALVAAPPPVVVPPAQPPVVAPPQAPPTGGGLPATGARLGLPLLAVVLLGAAAALRRRSVRTA